MAQAQTDSVTEQRRQTEEAYARGELTDEDYDAAMDEFDRAEEERISRSGEKYSFGGTQKNTAESGVTGKRNKNLGMEASEIQAVQSIGRKSVNAFTSADIQKTEGLARRYWTEMREKSPFFRAWFGDWRVNDQTPVLIANKADDTRGIQKTRIPDGIFRFRERYLQNRSTLRIKTHLPFHFFRILTILSIRLSCWIAMV